MGLDHWSEFDWDDGVTEGAVGGDEGAGEYRLCEFGAGNYGLCEACSILGQ